MRGGLGGRFLVWSTLSAPRLHIIPAQGRPDRASAEARDSTELFHQAILYKPPALRTIPLYTVKEFAF
jgi:hypothetical protein